jgi:hypothetical protein
MNMLLDYRQQWKAIGTPFRSSGFFFNHQLTTAVSPLLFFYGLYFSHDQSGDGKLRVTDLQLSGGVKWRLSDQSFSLAFGSSYISKDFQPHTLTFPGQYDNTIGRFNPTLNNQEFNLNDELNYVDAHAGIHYRRIIGEFWEIETGAFVNHLFSPGESFLNQDNLRSQAWGINISAPHQFNSSLIIQPAVSYYRISAATEWLLGGRLTILNDSWPIFQSLTPFLFLRWGVNRTTDAVIIGSRAGFGQFDVGFSYDINVSSLDLATDNRGGFELSVFYNFHHAVLPERRIPCLRY